MTFSTVAGSPTFNQGGGVFQLKKKPDAADMFWGHNNKIFDSDLHAPDVLDLVSSAALVATKRILATRSQQLVHDVIRHNMLGTPNSTRTSSHSATSQWPWSRAGLAGIDGKP